MKSKMMQFNVKEQAKKTDLLHNSLGIVWAALAACTGPPASCESVPLSGLKEHLFSSPLLVLTPAKQ